MASRHLALVFLVAIGTGDGTRCPAPPPAVNFTLADVSGTWYEIGKVQTKVGAFFEGDCECTALTFAPNADGTAVVSNACQKSGAVTVTNTSLTPTIRGPGAFLETFTFGPIKNTLDYTFIALNVDGEQFAVEFDCSVMLDFSLQYCFHVLARNRYLSETAVNELLGLLTKYQLNPANLDYQQTTQTGCVSDTVVI